MTVTTISADPELLAKELALYQQDHQILGDYINSNDIQERDEEDQSLIRIQHYHVGVAIKILEQRLARAQAALQQTTQLPLIGQAPVEHVQV